MPVKNKEPVKFYTDEKPFFKKLVAMDEKRMVILGGGESGVGAAFLARQKGFEVFLSDEGFIQAPHKNELIVNKIDFEEGGHTEDLILNAHIIVKSPGIPETKEIIKKIRAAGIKVISEIELAYIYKNGSKVIAISGSNGKSTTTAMVYHICKTAGFDCALVGNIGYSFARQVAEEPKDVYVAEVSSFQLDDIIQFRPDIAILTNITEDHLDRYDYNFENYIRSKFNLIKNQTTNEFFIYCLDDEVTMKYFNKFLIRANALPFTMNKPLPRGAYISDAKMHIKWQQEEMTMSVDDFTVKGKHNQYNTMAAGLAAIVMDIRKDRIREAIQTFESLAHRMEYVATIRGVEFINDSKATNVNSTWFALESMTKPVILILGGVDKGNDYSFITDLVKEKVKAIICMGIDNTKIHEAFGNFMELIVNTNNTRDAVQSAFHFAAKGDVVLLSPACASFDLFKNYEDRGNQFKSAVNEL